MHTMKRLALITASLATLLAGCAQYGTHMPPKPDPTRPKITFDGKMINVDQEVLAYKADGKPVSVIWSLPADGKFRFVQGRGIVVEGRITDELIRGDRISAVLDTKQAEIVDCAADETRLNYTCINKRSKVGVYKYTIRITDGNTVIERDPMMANW
jgi:hypothetical protein